VFCAVIFLSFGVVGEAIIEKKLTAVGSVIFESGWVGRLALAFGVIVPFLVLQTATHLLGDGYGWLGIFSQGDNYIHKWTEPLSILIVRTIQSLLGGYTLDTATTAFRMISVLSGGLFVWSVIGIARELTDDINKRLLILSTLLFSGAIILFMGYIEFYAPLWATATLWLYFALRYINGRSNWIVVVLTFLLAVSIHLEALIFFPALLVLLVSRIESDSIRRTGYILIGVLAAIATIAIIYLYHTRIAIEVLILPLFNGRPQAPDYAVFSLPHLFDIINQALLVLPGILLLAYWALRGRTQNKNSTHLFLLILTTGGVIFLLFFGAGITMARDWDVMSVTLLPLGLFLLYRIVESELKLKAASVVGYLLTTLLISGAFVAVNANTKDSEQRFETLLNNRQRSGWVIYADYLNQTGQSEKRKGVVDRMNRLFPDHLQLRLAFDQLNRGRIDQAARISEKLVAHDPYQAEFLQLLANVREKQRKFDDARDLFETALKLQPYRAEILNEYGQLLMATKEYNAALPILKKARSVKPSATSIAESLALDYIHLADYDAASAIADTLFAADKNSPGAHLIELTIALNKGDKVKAMIHYAEFVAHGQGRSDYDTMKKYYDYLAQ